MKCEQIQPNLLDYALGKLSQPESEQVREHIKECSECAALLKEEVAFSERMAAIDIQQPQNDVWALVHNKIRPKRARVFIWLGAFMRNGYRIAAAAMLVAILLLTSIYTFKPTNNEPANKVPTWMVQVKWSDDPMGSQTDATIDYIDNM